MEKKINKDELLKLNLTYSSILSAKIGDEILPYSYKEILDKLILKFTANKLKRVSLFANNIKDGEFREEDNNYYYIEELNISYCVLSSNDSIKEILNLLYHLNMSFEIKIKLMDKIIVEYNNNT